MADYQSGAERFALMIQERVLAALDRGQPLPWDRPWDVALELPYNGATAQAYRGANVMALMLAGYADPRWYGFQQASGLNAQVRKGEQGTLILMPVAIEAGYDAQGQPIPKARGGVWSTEPARIEQRVGYKVRTVFNAEQIDGLPPRVRTPHAVDRDEHIEALLAGFGVPILHGGQGAYYALAAHAIHLPMRAAFKSAEGYYATALHEAAHATGHPTLLGRDLSGRFGTLTYAEEELRAEMASYIACATLGVAHNLEQHVHYTASWATQFKDEPGRIAVAAMEAVKIAEFLTQPARRLDLIAERAGREGARSAPPTRDEVLSFSSPTAVEDVARLHALGVAAASDDGRVTAATDSMTARGVEWARVDPQGLGQGVSARAAAWGRFEPLEYTQEPRMAEKQGPERDQTLGVERTPGTSTLEPNSSPDADISEAAAILETELLHSADDHAQRTLEQHVIATATRLERDQDELEREQRKPSVPPDLGLDDGIAL